MEQVKPPYADITGIENGKKAVKIHRCPIVYNEHSESFEFQGITNMKIIKIEYNWPSMMTDLNNATRRRVKKEKERLQGLNNENHLEINGEIYDKEFFHKKSKGAPTQRPLEARKVEVI